MPKRGLVSGGYYYLVVHGVMSESPGHYSTRGVRIRDASYNYSCSRPEVMYLTEISKSYIHVLHTADICIDIPMYIIYIHRPT